MEKRGIKRLPVMRGQELVGIISRANLVRAMASRARAAQEPTKDDADIRDRLVAEIDRQAWSPRSLVDVAVHDGVVELRGCVLNDQQRQALKVVAENIPGVKSVEDHLVWVEPVSGMVINSPDDKANEARTAVG